MTRSISGTPWLVRIKNDFEKIRDAKAAYGRLLAEYSLLSQDVLLTALLFDQYQKKVEETENIGIIPSDYRHFFSTKKEQIIRSERSLQSLAQVIATRKDVLNRELVLLEAVAP